MEKIFSYDLNLTWTGNQGEGTQRYTSYQRSYIISAEGKPSILGSSDPTFLGNPACWNPEELLVAAVSACHMLWYLHICTTMGLKVEKYEDTPKAEMVVTSDGSGAFKKIDLHPCVHLAADDSIEKAKAAHEISHQKCFIANSVNFPISILPTFIQS